VAYGRRILIRRTFHDRPHMAQCARHRASASQQRTGCTVALPRVRPAILVPRTLPHLAVQRLSGALAGPLELYRITICWAAGIGLNVRSPSAELGTRLAVWWIGRRQCGTHCGYAPHHDRRLSATTLRHRAGVHRRSGQRWGQGTGAVSFSARQRGESGLLGCTDPQLQAVEHDAVRIGVSRHNGDSVAEDASRFALAAANNRDYTGEAVWRSRGRQRDASPSSHAEYRSSANRWH